MAIVLTHVGRTPGQSQFALDAFTEHYKANETADIVLTDASVPQRGDAHPDYRFMFVTDRRCVETGERASALDLVYTGCLKDTGGGTPLPVLPPFKHQDGDAVASASTSTSSAIWPRLATSPATLQYYSPTSEVVAMSQDAAGTGITYPDPPLVTVTGLIT